MTAPFCPRPPRAVRRPALGGLVQGGLAVWGPALWVPALWVPALWVPALGGQALPGPALAIPTRVAQAPPTAPASQSPAAPLRPAPAPSITASPAPRQTSGQPSSPSRDASWAFDPAGPFLPGGPDPSAPKGLGLPLSPGDPLPAWPAPTPKAIAAPRPQIPPCPLIVPAKDFALQPLHIPPSQVRFKNSLGCLSAADAIYGPDGCPRRLCGTDRGVRLTLPTGGP